MEITELSGPGKKMKTQELKGKALDCWVARGLKLRPVEGQPVGFFHWYDRQNGPRSGWFAPSSDWEHGGYIIENEGIDIRRTGEEEWAAGAEFMYGNLTNYRAFGRMPLVAAMRFFVQSKFGDEIPSEFPA